MSNSPSPELPARRDTRFQPGNQAARRHGLYSQQLQDDAAPWRQAQIAAITADLGGDVSTLQAHTIEQAATTLVVLRFLGENLMAMGPLTGKGRARAATGLYLQVLDRHLRIVEKLGIGRQSKPLTNPADWLEGK